MNNTAERVHTFASSSEAWAYMRECDAKGLSAGFPQRYGQASYAVKVLVPLALDVTPVDDLNDPPVLGRPHPEGTLFQRARRAGAR